MRSCPCNSAAGAPVCVCVWGCEGVGVVREGGGEGETGSPVCGCSSTTAPGVIY